MNRKAQQRGFTLIELMIALAVLSTLMVVGVPAFQTFVQNNRQISEHNSVVMSLLSARSEAVRANVPVVMCTSNNGSSCRDCATDLGCANWEDGWILFTDVVRTNPTTEEGVVNATAGTNAEVCESDEDCVLAIYDGLGAGSTLRLAGAGSNNAIAYNATGASDVSGTFTMCVPKTTVYKKLVITSTGRPKTEEASPSGAKVLSCP